MKDLKHNHSMSIVLITHDLGIVSDICDKIIIMYGGEIMEYGPIESLYSCPSHPYTNGLINSLPKIDEDVGAKLTPIEGAPVDLMHPPAGCPFAPRCEKCMKVCLTEKPPYFEMEPNHYSACWLHYDRKGN
jgi:oligopeptide transport system ATP-binding protein